jgi:hypothetical protein
VLKYVLVNEAHIGPAQYFAKDNDHVVLTHVVQVQDPQTGGWKQAYVDATSGDIVNVADFVAEASVSPSLPFA